MAGTHTLLAVLLVEAALGYPAWLFRMIGHPVSWCGRLITLLDRSLNRRSIAGGLGAALILLGIGGGTGWLIERAATRWIDGRGGSAIIILAGSTALAQRSLWDHLRAVQAPLDAGDTASARMALARVVGRDVQALDESGVAAAGIETLAESFCDGVIAPAFWFLLLGLPGLFAFKAISTADSMIGHRDAAYERFGKASARLDDVLNFMPARIAALLICLAGRGGWHTMARDAGKHLSPNAGWPESAMAGALKVRLGGGAFYGDEWIGRAELGQGPRPVPADLARAIGVYQRACVLLWLIAGGCAWLG